MTDQLDRETELRRRYRLGPAAPEPFKADDTPLGTEVSRLRALARRFRLDAGEDVLHRQAVVNLLLGGNHE